MANPIQTKLLKEKNIVSATHFVIPNTIILEPRVFTNYNTTYFLTNDSSYQKSILLSADTYSVGELPDSIYYYSPTSSTTTLSDGTKAKYAMISTNLANIGTETTIFNTNQTNHIEKLTFKNNVTNETSNVTVYIKNLKAIVFGFQYSYSGDGYKYLNDAVGMKPCQMDMFTETFDYGSWEDAWFVKYNRPISMSSGYPSFTTYRSDIDADPYDKYFDAATSTSKIAMTCPIVWFKESENSNVLSWYYSNVKYDSNYKAPAHTFKHKIRRYFYYSAWPAIFTAGTFPYKFYNYGERIRFAGNGLSDNTLETNMQELKTKISTYLSYYENCIYPATYLHRSYINRLLILMGCTFDIPSKFGTIDVTQAVNNNIMSDDTIYTTTAPALIQDDNGKINYQKTYQFAYTNTTLANSNISRVAVFGINDFYGIKPIFTPGIIYNSSSKYWHLQDNLSEGFTSEKFDFTGSNYSLSKVYTNIPTTGKIAGCYMDYGHSNPCLILPEQFIPENTSTTSQHLFVNASTSTSGNYKYALCGGWFSTDQFNNSTVANKYAYKANPLYISFTASPTDINGFETHLVIYMAATSDDCVSD